MKQKNVIPTIQEVIQYKKLEPIRRSKVIFVDISVMFIKKWKSSCTWQSIQKLKPKVNHFQVHNV